MEVPVLEHATERGKLWRWFVAHAKSRYALAWLALVSFTDTLFSPITSEPFLAALILAHRDRWKIYLPVALTFSALGTATGYWLFYFLFRSFGEALLASWGLTEAYAMAQQLLAGPIFWAMLTASFTPLPDKAFIYAAGILGAPFAPFMIAFVIGRGARMSVVAYVVWRFGTPVLEMVDRYFIYVTIAAVAILALYGIVHFDLLPW